MVVPAFILSELKTAFQMGFLLFLPFLVIDLVVSSVLLSMGMFMLPPVMISTPIKVLVFVLVDGWRLVCESVVVSFTRSRRTDVRSLDLQIVDLAGTSW